MKRLVGACLALTLVAAVPARGGSPLLAEKVRTERKIEVQTVIAAPPNEVFELWLSPEGLRTFFAPKARIEPVEGGRYELMFDPTNDPEGEREGTKGARVLALEKGRFLAFEWRGRSSMAEMNTEPLPTWVELRFEPVAGEPRKTRLSLGHYGFGSGGGWELGYVFFKSAWSVVIASLRSHFAGLAPAPPRAPETIARWEPGHGWSTLAGR